ncbi:glycoside hydrolase family 9 protein [Cytophagaceae bacterium DM2B3-1]|uniref:Endoglucanase n=1 Tax=Xanthocytophaga flava TaxID=3048013 RepID=A0ABT7CVM1_9BACT|nr:glycoside hydrolase family 9 protein [Xanthocytophaga flavus]MDJ1496985.1 glycoside hydrolase family 9 protein [Xanthocytophaga flavus]
MKNWFTCPLFFLLFIFTICFSHSALSQTTSDKIRLNQIGFYPNGPKTAAIITAEESSFYILNTTHTDTLFSGKLQKPVTNAISGKIVRLADFSSFHKQGTFILSIPAVGYSYPFTIKNNVHHLLAVSTLKSYYYQRASIPLISKFAGQWARAEGHPDTQILIHPSAASANHPAGTIISSSRGWYDAGDYNKYIVNSGITMGTLLSLYEDFPKYTETIHTNIPESQNAIPDLLDEILWNLRWMLTMQDAEDGGVYHKLTNASFDGMIMPDRTIKPRYVVKKNTIATLDFAAVMAQASRVFRKYPKQLPGLADSCLQSAQKAWIWAQNNPEVLYQQNLINQQNDPDITTGSYEDKSNKDEWVWAATELYVTTKDNKYYPYIKQDLDNALSIPSWNQVRTLAYYTLSRYGSTLTQTGKKDLPSIQKHITSLADNLLKDVEMQPYGTVMGKTAKDYIWGSNSLAANQGIALVYAYQITHNSRYLHYALSNLDFILGRNGTGYCYVTGSGSKSPHHPHHRPSIADGIDAPIPGLLAGGANPGQQDKCEYPTTIADECYADIDCSYATNEIAINWNAPMVYLVTALEALQRSIK